MTTTTKHVKTPLLFVGACVLLFICGQCDAADLKMTPIPSDFETSPKILGGRPAIPADWPATRVFISDSGYYCTATVIGERTLVTAAHCIIENPRGVVTWNNQHVTVICKPHPEYNDAPRYSGDLQCHLRVFPTEFSSCTADIALCSPAEDKTFAAIGGKFERIKPNPPVAIKGENITLLGYGCVSPSVKITGVLSVGTAKVIQMPKPHSGSALEQFILTDGAASCDGDSGGAAYSSEIRKSREIVGINSRGNLSKGSDLVNVLDPRIVQFFRDFSPPNALQICGLDQAARNCAF